MSYNKYNSGRFNTMGQFVPAGELSAGPQGGFGGAPAGRTLQPVQFNKPLPQANSNQNQSFSTTFQPPAPPPPPSNANNGQPTDIDMKVEPDQDCMDNSRPPWMKAKLQGVKKLSNKERRRRQNENLRRLLSPKSALMVLNEIMPGEQLTSQFHVEAVGGGANQYYRSNGGQSFCAALTVQGNSYKGYGENKLTARNAAAEQVVRDLILRKMTKVLMPEAAGNAEESGEGGEGEGEETLPMIQLASFALHKLFSEWEYEGHRVPQLRASNQPVSETASVTSDAGSAAPQPKPRAPKPKVLPENASSMHPCMLLTYMRPQLEYRELGVEGDRPQSMVFTMGVEVDGTTYMGKASNKKEARKQAARAACAAVFGVHFDAPH